MKIIHIIKRFIPKFLSPLVTFFYNKLRFLSSPKIFELNGGGNHTLNALVAYNEYGGYCIPRESIHRPAAQAVMRGEIWEPDTIEFIINNCANGDVVHAGTYFGDFLPRLSLEVAKTAQIWAFEPNPINFRCAEITILLNRLTNVTLCNAGLGEITGKASLQVADIKGKAMGGSSTINNNKNLAGLSKHELIGLTKLDDAIPRNREITVIQLDVEGYELQALQGAIGIISNCKPLLILEVVPSNDWINDNIINKFNYINIGNVHGNTILKSYL